MHGATGRRSLITGDLKRRANLKALGAPEPSDLPPYDESKYEPMPEVEIDPPDLPIE
jgi:hypothetical protein